MLTFQYSIDSKLPPAFVPAGSNVSHVSSVSNVRACTCTRLERVRRDPARG